MGGGGGVGWPPLRRGQNCLVALCGRLGEQSRTCRPSNAGWHRSRAADPESSGPTRTVGPRPSQAVRQSALVCPGPQAARSSLAAGDRPQWARRSPGGARPTMNLAGGTRPAESAAARRRRPAAARRGGGKGAAGGPSPDEVRAVSSGSFRTDSGLGPPSRSG